MKRALLFIPGLLLCLLGRLPCCGYLALLGAAMLGGNIQ
jgi:hypothetical protein